MKRFKKLLSTLLACIMILGSVSVFAAEDISVLKGMGIAPDSFAEAVGDDLVTRGEYAYMMANLLNKDDMDPMDTRFTDVTKADYFSGHIEFLATRGVAGGYGDGTFGKDDPVSLETAYVFLVRLLGLESFVRAQEGSTSSFTHFAYTIGLKSGNYTNAEGYVTKKGAAAIVHDALTASLPKAEWSTEGGELILNNDRDSKSNILSENLGISSYDAYVKAVDMEDYTVTFEITKNNYKNNPIVIPEGTTKTFLAASGVNIYEYDRTPVSIWVDEDEKIIDIQYKKDVEIRYVNIVSVNGDDAEHTYRVGSINRMTFLDDEEVYEVAQGATYKINGKDFTGQTALAGNYAKVVLVKDEITHVESWDLKEGGIIQEISNEKVTYTYGDTTKTISDLADYKSKLYFIGGRSASLSEVKPNSVFYYYTNEEDYIVFVISEVIITDVLDGISTDSMTIGNNIINYDKYFYFKTLGNAFKKSEDVEKTTMDFLDLCGLTVNAYIAHNGNVLYVAPEDASSIEGSFYGVVVGVQKEIWDDEAADIKIYELRGKEITEKVYKYTVKKSKSPDGIKLDDLEKVASDIYGNGIFLFKVNNEGVITQIKRPEAFPIFESSQKSYAYNASTIFNLSGRLYLQLKDDNYENVGSCAVWYLKPPSVIYKIALVQGNFEVSTVAVKDITGEGKGIKAKMIIYGEKNSLAPTFMAMTSAPELTKKDGKKVAAYDIAGMGGGTEQYGVITKKTAVSVDGEKKTKLVIEGLNGISSYYVTNSTASKLGIDTLIRYTVNPEFYDDQIKISKSNDIEAIADISNDDPTKWGVTNIESKMKNLTVITGTEEGIFFKDKDSGNIRALTYNPQETKFLIVDMTGKERVYKKGSSLDVEENDVMWYSVNEGIEGLVIVVKQ